MSHHTSARLFVAAAVVVTLAACSSQVPVVPGELFSVERGNRDS